MRFHRNLSTMCNLNFTRLGCLPFYPNCKTGNYSRCKSVVVSYELRHCSSGVKLREIPLHPSLQQKAIENEEEADELRYTELKLALGMLQGRSAFGAEQLLLVHPHVRWGSGSAPKNATPEMQVEEAQTLCQTIPGFRVVSSIIVNTDYNVRKKLIWGSGRLQAVLHHKLEHNITALMINIDALSPLQQRELTAYFGVPIYDRLNIVLSIFKLYARTKESKLQIALAEIPLIRSHISFANSFGTSKNELPSQIAAPAFPTMERLESNRQLEFLRLREHKIRKQIRVEIESTGQKLIERKARCGPGKTPVIGVVGYTNSGKTTFIKRLTDSPELLGENRLFATLDTTTHLTTMPSSSKAIFADTIGFISNLPIQLLASFSATLQHVENADLLIHIMDLSHPDLLAQRDNVMETLNGLKINKSLIDNIINVGNKLDKCDEERRRQLVEWGILGPENTDNNNSNSSSIFSISCRTSEGLPLLVEQIDKRVQLLSGARMRRLRLSHDSQVVTRLYQDGLVGTPSECGRFLLFDVLMTEEEFAKFQASIGMRLRRKGEER